MTEATTAVRLGEGVLTWRGSERRSDRYGTVHLIAEGHNSMTAAPSPSLVQPARDMAGCRGKLIALVKGTRESTHIGDLFRGIYPVTPDIGERIEFGDGVLFFERIDSADEGGIAVGLRPEDGRAGDWLDPEKLYRAHEQSVELLFEPSAAA